MKKRILSFVITIAMLIVLPISVSAKNSIELQCASDDLPINLTTTCEFIAISDSDIGGYSFTLDVPKNISFGSLKEADGWLVSINGNKIAAASANSVKSGSVIATVFLTNQGNAFVDTNRKVVIKDIEMTLIKSDGSVTSEKVNDVTKKFYIHGSISRATLYIGIGVLVIIIGLVIFKISKKKKSN